MILVIIENPMDHVVDMNNLYFHFSIMPTIQEKLSRVISDGASSENEKNTARKILSALPKEIKINY